MTAEITKLYRPPLSVGAAALYGYHEAILDACKRQARYPDTEGKTEFNLARVIGGEYRKRIQVPRNMASSIPVDLRVDGDDYAFTSSFQPRNSEQARCVKEAVALLRQGNNFILESPTGTGKTWSAVDIISQIGKKAIVVVTKEDILDQWVAAIEALLGLKPGAGIGFIKGDKCNVVGQGIVIAMIQSICKEDRYPETVFSPFGLALFDECHRVGADVFSQACFRLPALLRMGLSATPDRKDGREEVIAAHIGPVMVRTTIAPMTPRIIVQESPWKIPMNVAKDEAGRVILNLDGSVKMVQVPHSPGKCGHVINMVAGHAGRNQIIARFVLQAYKAGRKILVQSDRKEHLDTLALLITSMGVPPQEVTYYVGGLKASQREQAKTGRVVMATFSMTSEATDIPTLDTLVMATPKSDVRQIVGRIIRLVEGKKEPVVFDLLDDSSSVFAGYAAARSRWYASIGAEVQVVRVKS